MPPISCVSATVAVMPACFPRTAQRLRDAGIEVVTVDVSELQKAEGATTCCSLVFEAIVPAGQTTERSSGAISSRHGFQGRRGMSWFGIVLVVLGLYLAFKVAGFFLKLLMWALVILGIYWLASPHLGLPQLF